MPRENEINRNWVVEAITNPVLGSGGSLVVTSSRLGIVESAYVAGVSGQATGALPIVPEVAQTQLYPGGSLSATLPNGQFVLTVNQISGGTLVPAAAGTLSGVTIFVLEHGN